MSKADDAVTCFKAGYSCSQAIAATFGPNLGLSREQALSMASGFGGGMGMAETCGAVTGAYMVLGLRFARGDTSAPQSRAEVKAAVAQSTELFRERRGTVICRELLGCDISTPAGMDIARKQGLLASTCPKLVHDAGQILEQMLE